MTIRRSDLSAAPIPCPFQDWRLWMALVLICTFGIASAAIYSADLSSRFLPDKLVEINQTIERAIAEKKCPGGVLWLENQGAVYHRAYGHRSEAPQIEAMTPDTIFDAASVTKVMATTAAIMALIEDNKLKLDEPVARYAPEFGAHGKEGITLRSLLTHTSGLRPSLSLALPWEGVPNAWRLSCEEIPQQAQGTKFVYSDINFIVLGELVRRVSGENLHQFCLRRFYRPLKMSRTTFFPRDAKQVAPTERLTNGVVLRGIVHDPTARRMGGIAGHAGLFTTASDVARFSRMVLQKGTLDGVQVLKPSTVALMTTVQTPSGIPRRGLGWDIDSPYAGPRGSKFPIGSFGHTGWTGPSVWIDPFTQTMVIFMANRNHPTEDGNILPLRRQLGTLAAEAVKDVDWDHIPGALPQTVPASSTSAEVLPGIDVLARDEFRILKGRKVGLITNHTGRNRSGQSTIDLLFRATGVELKALFSPEHGIRGSADEHVGDGRDSATGLPIYSLYGKTYRPSLEQMRNLDTLVFDIQDIGCRFYTYISTLGNCLEAAAEGKKTMIVLDRPNPLGGEVVDGPILTGPRSFVAWHELPLRHGMTIGELAKLFCTERNLNVDLHVIPCAGWKRSQWWDQTGIPWINPSPNMRSLTAATLYPGVGVIEFCQISVGRGTDQPFLKVGAPYIDARKLVSRLNLDQLPGVSFFETEFTPSTSVFAGKHCNGVRFELTDRSTFSSPILGLALASAIHQQHPQEFNLLKMNALLGDERTLTAIREGVPIRQIASEWIPALDNFKKRRLPFLIYP